MTVAFVFKSYLSDLVSGSEIVAVGFGDADNFEDVCEFGELLLAPMLSSCLFAFFSIVYIFAHNRYAADDDADVE